MQVPKHYQVLQHFMWHQLPIHYDNCLLMPLIFVVWEKENEDGNKKKTRNHDLDKSS